MKTNSIYSIAVIEGVIPAMAKRAQYSPGFRRGVGGIVLDAASGKDMGESIGNIFRGDYTDDLINLSNSGAVDRLGGIASTVNRYIPDAVKRWALNNPLSRNLISNTATAYANKFINGSTGVVPGSSGNTPANAGSDFASKVKNTWDNIPTSGKWAIGAGGLALGLGAVSGMFGGTSDSPAYNVNVYGDQAPTNVTNNYQPGFRSMLGDSDPSARQRNVRTDGTSFLD